ncbi:MAG: hypothetical protein IT443_07505 [Phycisphaeraceae bacterium]|nr:hypothetical protein [Phycisphaeraceae bacterium]
MMRIEGDSLFIQTRTLRALVRRGVIVSLVNLATGKELIAVSDCADKTALSILYRAGEAVELTDRLWGKIDCRLISPTRAEFLLETWDGIGILAFSEDPQTGDLIVEPSVSTRRPGVRAVRWTLLGLCENLEFIGPLFQGARLPMGDKLLQDFRWNWPQYWEAALVMLQDHTSEGLWVHAQDTHSVYKALRVLDAQSLALETEAFGPIDHNRAAGSLAWRLNVYQGGWEVPAERYRQWLTDVYPLQAQRPAWTHDVRLALSWCPSEPDILQALAERIDPKKVIVHLSSWRTDGYDQNYPTYEADARAKEFIARGQELGFHVMPHFNALESDPIHPAHEMIRDFLYQDVETKRTQGWAWSRGPIAVPEGPTARLHNRDRNVMAKTHPGLQLWRHLLGQAIGRVAADLKLDAVFIDVTLVTGNLDQCLVENQTSTQGMRKLIQYVAELGPGLVVGGEGLNETTLDLSFAQAHLFKWGGTSLEDLERCSNCNINQFLFGRWCRTIGYSRLNGPPDEALRVLKAYANQGVMPTIIGRSAQDIRQKHPAVEAALNLAGL